MVKLLINTIVAALIIFIIGCVESPHVKGDSTHASNQKYRLYLWRSYDNPAWIGAIYAPFGLEKGHVWTNEKGAKIVIVDTLSDIIENTPNSSDSILIDKIDYK